MHRYKFNNFYFKSEFSDKINIFTKNDYEQLALNVVVWI